MNPTSHQLLYPALCASRFNHTCLPFYHPSSISIFVHKHTPRLSKRALSISLRRCAYLSSSGRYPACLGMEGFEPPSTRDLSRILAPTSCIPIMSRTNRGIVCKKRSLKHVHLHFGGMGRDGLEPTESEDTRFTVWPATNYGISSLNRHRPVSNSFVRAMPCTMRFLRIISFYRQSTRRSFTLKQ